ncbi:MAG: exonuclease SbcCD subunit D C-terminal domain-containing protein [Hyphomicrobiales bacterium]|nr:exonuclease SbcCD subunit D C-terminal domain-containing protein [Hyphomicrobiales bacterium]
MVRLLHTADWHIGAELNGFARTREHARLFDLLVEVVESERVDGLIVAGDVYDHQNPAIDAQRMLFELIDRLILVRPTLTMVMIAGNHDSAGRIDAPGPLLRRANVHAIGALSWLGDDPDLDRHLVPIRDESGAIGAHVLAIPYLRPADLPSFRLAQEPGAPSPIEAAVAEVYRRFVEAARCRIGPDAPLVATGHLHLSGAILSESIAERRILIGGEHAITGRIFPADLAYVALGHLHKPQAVGAETVRYAGSPFPMSNAERGYDHGVSLVELDGGTVTILHRSLPRPVPFLRVPETGRIAPKEIAEALEKLALAPEAAESDWPFVQVFVAVDGPAPGLHADIEDAAAGFPLRLVGIDVKRPEWGPDAGADPPPRLSERSPEEIFAEAFRAAFGVEPDTAHRDAFRRALEEAGQ